MFVAMSLCRYSRCSVSMATSLTVTAVATLMLMVMTVLMIVTVTDSRLRLMGILIQMRILIQMGVWRGFLSVSSLSNVCSVVDG